jgi:hypothetical protein
MIDYVPHPRRKRRVFLDGEDVTRLCWWADTKAGELCLFVEKDGVQQFYKDKTLGHMLKTEIKRGVIVIEDVCQ